LTAKARRLWTLYRITPDEQLAIEAYQRKHPAFRLLLGKHMGTDHCHSTGLIRGRLEWRINRAYGLIEKVNPEKTGDILRALADFHDNPPATTVLGSPRHGLLGLAKYKKKMIYGPPKGVNGQETV
jgi:hypothetical protein